MPFNFSQYKLAGPNRPDYGAISVNMLIVDNEIVQVENLRIGLSIRGHHVLFAMSGHEALNLIEKNALGIELVITDYAMPGINGIEFLQNIRWRHGRLPVILMTAYRQRNIVLDALRNQCNGFIDKPFTLDQLINEIDRVMADVQNMTPEICETGSTSPCYAIMSSGTSEDSSSGSIMS
jgi:two-component system, NtrC family, response regulator AtoC